MDGEFAADIDTSQEKKRIKRKNGNSLTAGESAELAVILQTLLSVRDGDFSVRLPVVWTGPTGRIADAFNEIVSANQQMALELKRLGQTLGKEGKVRERVRFTIPRGAWGEMENSVNTLTEDLLRPITEVTRAIAAVAQGNLTQTVRLEVDNRPLEGEFLRSANIVNTMIQQLGVFTAEVTRVAREVSTDGKLGGQADVQGVAGTWKDLTDSVNSMASNLTGQVRDIAEVATAIASGDLSRKITVDVRGEILQLKETLNTMVEQLYLSVPIVPELLRAKVSVFVELYRKNRELETVNNDLSIAGERLRRLTGRLMQIQDAERRRVARDVHDGLGQYLVGVKMGIDQLARRLSRDPGMHESTTEISMLLNRAINETRTISHLLHPPLLDEVGLESALAVYSDAFAKRSGIAVTVDVAADLGRLDSDVETALFRVVQECLLNVHRHSNSTSAGVTLRREDGAIRLEVRDQGVGMSTAVDGTGLGVGLLGIRERIRQLDGKLQIISSNGLGTSVIATVPSRPRKEATAQSDLVDGPAAIHELS